MTSASPATPAARTADEVGLSIIIPAYNEETRIGPTLEAIGAWAARQPRPVEIVVVDDGSRDRTADVARAALPAVRILRNDGNRGKGFTVRRGVAEARGEIILFTDADNSTDIAEFDKFQPRFSAGADVVIASRALPDSQIEIHQGRLRETAGRAFNWMLRIITGLPFRDTQCGFKAFRREAAQAIFPRQRIIGWGFDAEIIAIALRLGYRVEEVPVRWVNSPDSRLKMGRDAPKILADLIRLRWNDWRGRYR